MTLRVLAGAVLVGILGFGSAGAQTSVPPGRVDPFKDTSVLKLPAGMKVAILEFDDLECPGCAHVLPMVEAAAAHNNVPILHHDYPLTEIHVWSFDAAVTARYLHDALSPKVGDDFRRDLFAHQSSVNSKDDLARFTKEWFATHKLRQPAVIDKTGKYAAEVKADRALGDRLGIKGTPTMFVLTPTAWVQVVWFSQLDATVAKAVAESGSAGKH